MPRSATVDLVPGVWTQLTNDNVSAITFANIDAVDTAYLMATVGAVPPTSLNGAIPYGPRSGELDVALNRLFAGVGGANRVYAYSTNSMSVVVQHA